MYNTLDPETCIDRTTAIFVEITRFRFSDFTASKSMPVIFIETEMQFHLLFRSKILDLSIFYYFR